jgi:hypothetical protein
METSSTLQMPKLILQMQHKQAYQDVFHADIVVKVFFASHHKVLVAPRLKAG